jgi:hypothetical protein
VHCFAVVPPATQAAVRSRSATARRGCTILALSAAAAIACDENAALERVSRARHLAADLHVQFTKAADSASKAVLADTDEASRSFAHHAEQAKQAVQTDVDALRPLLQQLNLADETRLLNQFVASFDAYSELDRRILDLAVENTNLKAQRLSFGPAQEAADAFRDDLQSVVPADPARDGWQVKALVSTAVQTVREIQVLQAPHIANADDEVMARMEAHMQVSEATARRAVEALAPLLQRASREQLTRATAALDRFMSVNAEITALSRRNTNVRSLALSLSEKSKTVAACEESLAALRDLLATRGLTGRRYGAG